MLYVCDRCGETACGRGDMCDAVPLYGMMDDRYCGHKPPVYAFVANTTFCALINPLFVCKMVAPERLVSKEVTGVFVCRCTAPLVTRRDRSCETNLYGHIEHTGTEKAARAPLIDVTCSLSALDTLPGVDSTNLLYELVVDQMNVLGPMMASLQASTKLLFELQCFLFIKKDIVTPPQLELAIELLLLNHLLDCIKLISRELRDLFGCFQSTPLDQC